MVDNGRAPLRRGRLRLDLPLDDALRDLCSLLASDAPAEPAQPSQPMQLKKQLSQSKLLADKGAMIVKSGMQRSESLHGGWSQESSDTMKKCLRENRKRVKSHASQLLEAYTRRGRDGYGAFDEQVKNKYNTVGNSTDTAKQVLGTKTTSEASVTLKDGVELPIDRISSKLSDFADKKARSPVGKPDDRVEEGEEDVVEPKKEEKVEKVSEAILARKLNMPFDVLKDACDIFRKYSDCKIGMDIGKAQLDMNNFVKVVCELCNVSSADALHPDFVDETFRTADRDCSGYIDVEEFCVWHASASFSEEMVLSDKDQQIRNISRLVGIPLVDVERFWTAFRKFDLDGSGNIEYEEFTRLLHVLMKVPTGHTLPKERVQGLWRQADSDGSGEINFEEFVLFYIQRFGYDPGQSDFDFSNFYKVRR